MDNLIAAYNDQMFVQVGYEKISVLDFDQAKGTIGTEQTLTSTSVGRPEALGKFARVFRRLASIDGSAVRSRRMSFYAQPVTNQDEVYAAYVQFAKNPTIFRVTPEKPECPVHMVRHCHDKYYWVPAEAAPAYLDLLLFTSFMRGEDKVVGYYDRRCVAQTPPEKVDGGFTYTITLDAPVPNGQALLVVLMPDGKKFRIKALSNPNVPDGPQPGTLTLDLQVKNGVSFPDLITDSHIRVYSNLYPPEVTGSGRTGAGSATVDLERALERLRMAR